MVLGYLEDTYNIKWDGTILSYKSELINTGGQSKWKTSGLFGFVFKFQIS